MSWYAVFDGSPNTLELYRTHVRNHISPCVGHLRRSKLDAETPDSFYAELRRCCSLGAESIGRVVASTVVASSPGTSDGPLEDVIAVDDCSERGEVVLVLGLVTAILAAMSAFAQLERGREPDLRHQARPARPAQVRQRRAAHRHRGRVPRPSGRC